MPIQAATSRPLLKIVASGTVATMALAPIIDTSELTLRQAIDALEIVLAGE